jgi:hypothetical protein
VLGWHVLGWHVLGWHVLGWHVLGWHVLGWHVLGWHVLGWHVLGPHVLEPHVVYGRLLGGGRRSRMASPANGRWRRSVEDQLGRSYGAGIAPEPAKLDRRRGPHGAKRPVFGQRGAGRREQVLAGGVGQAAGQYHDVGVDHRHQYSGCSTDSPACRTEDPESAGVAGPSSGNNLKTAAGTAGPGEARPTG